MEKQKKQTDRIHWLVIILNRYYKYFIIFLCLVILAGAGFFWLKPQYQDVLKLSSENLPLRQEKLDELAKYYNGLQELKDDLTSFEAKNQQNLEKLKKILPPEKGLADLFAQLEALITYRDKYELNSITFSEVDLSSKNKNSASQMNNDNPFNEDINSDYAGENGERADGEVSQSSKIGAIDIGLSISGGGYLDFKVLLGDIEKHLRIMDITAINFSDIYVDPQEDAKANYSITLRTYFIKD